MVCDATFYYSVSSNLNDLTSSPAAPEVTKPKLESADDIEVQSLFTIIF